MRKSLIEIRILNSFSKSAKLPLVTGEFVHLHIGKEVNMGSGEGTLRHSFGNHLSHLTHGNGLAEKIFSLPFLRPRWLTFL